MKNLFKVLWNFFSSLFQMIIIFGIIIAVFKIGYFVLDSHEIPNVVLKYYAIISSFGFIQAGPSGSTFLFGTGLICGAGILIYFILKDTIKLAISYWKKNNY